MTLTLRKWGVVQSVLQALLVAAFFFLVSPGRAEKCPTAQNAVGRTVVARTIAIRYLYDATLHRSWAVERDCDHPERPAWLAPMEGVADQTNPPTETTALPAISPAAEARVWVRGGSRVLVWRTSGDVQIQLTGVAVESAPLGAELAVRIGMQGAVIRGIVRGPDSVELVPASPQWGQP